MGFLDWNLTAALVLSSPPLTWLSSPSPGTVLPCLSFQMVRSAMVATREPDGFLLWGWGIKEGGRHVLVKSRVCVCL